jgi:ubiquitin carboxyl-terminal hydrolase 7
VQGTVADGVLRSVLMGDVKRYIKGVDVDFESSRIEEYDGTPRSPHLLSKHVFSCDVFVLDLLLDVDGAANLLESFESYIAVDLLDGENKYQTVEHGPQVANMGVSFVSFPPLLHIQLKRYRYDLVQDKMIKVRFVCSKTANFAQPVTYGTDQQSTRIPCRDRLITVHRRWSRQ